ncbi:MAG: electron transport complex subunit E [Lachnospiraceae bacterium]|nr:electron transport complex subunit E [Lachnospiraceae bacterium]
MDAAGYQEQEPTEQKAKEEKTSSKIISSQKYSLWKPLINGLVTENPTFVLMLGMCPTLAVTTSAINGLGMGLTTTVVLALSNIIISALRNVIPDKVRIPAFIVIIASFVTIVGQFLEAYLPALNSALGMFIPLIVVNCIILGRAEAFASKNGMAASCMDGLGMGLGFTIALTLIGCVREILGSFSVFGISFKAPLEHIGMAPAAIFVMAPGAFFVLAALNALMGVVREKQIAAGKESRIRAGCTHECTTCGEDGCVHRFYDEKGKDAAVGKKAE